MLLPIWNSSKIVFKNVVTIIIYFLDLIFTNLRYLCLVFLQSCNIFINIIKRIWISKNHNWLYSFILHSFLFLRISFFSIFINLSPSLSTILLTHIYRIMAKCYFENLRYFIEIKLLDKDKVHKLFICIIIKSSSFFLLCLIFLGLLLFLESRRFNKFLFKLILIFYIVYFFLKQIILHLTHRLSYFLILKHLNIFIFKNLL